MVKISQTSNFVFCSPHWDESTTPEQLDQLERESFLDWRKKLAECVLVLLAEYVIVLLAENVLWLQAEYVLVLLDEYVLVLLDE